MKKFLLLLILFIPSFVISQVLYPTDPDAFKNELMKRLKSYSNREEIANFMKTFPTEWDAGLIFSREKKELIEIINILEKRRQPLIPLQYKLVKTFLKVKDSTNYIQISSNQFFGIVKQLINEKRHKELSSFLDKLYSMLPEGEVFHSTQYVWKVTNPVIKELKYEEFFDTIFNKNTRGVFLYYDNTNLEFVGKGKTVVIRNIKGKLNLSTRYFYINEADYDWSRLGVEPNEIYVKLKSFAINMNTPEFSCKHATFYYPTFLNKSLNGEFKENLRQLKVDPIKASYPYFKSYDGGIVIENFIPHVRYEGGFTIKGLTKYGSKYIDVVTVRHKIEKEEDEGGEEYYDDEFGGGFYEDEESVEEEPQQEEEEYYEETFEMEKPASLTIFNLDNLKVLRIEGDEFALDPKKLVAENQRVTVFLKGGDSLYHPAMDLYYDVETQDISLSLNRKIKKGRHPIIDSYHKFFLYFGAIRWNPNENQIYFTEIIDKEHRKGALESMDFFVKYRYMQFKGILRFHPMGIIYRYYRDYGLTPKDWAPIYELLKTYKLQKYEKAFIYALEDLEGSGFVELDRKYGRVRPTKRLYVWVFAAMKKKDYDAIQLVSIIKSGNYGMLDYETKKLFVYGVQPFRFTDSQQVITYPYKGKIIALKNRDLDFGGVIQAGKINLYARRMGKFHFDYKYFKVVCDSIDSLKFFPERDPNFNPKAKKGLVEALKKLKLEDISGVLYIDKPWNKSGRKDYPEYPVFDSYKKAYVYWRDSSIQNGVYSKDKIQFQIDPFVIDTLGSFDLSYLEFYGKFECDSIMPSFRDTLKPVADNTYGIHQVLPPEGVPLYQGKGHYYGEVTMDHFGFHGKGKIDFLASVAESDTFLYHFDSVMAITKSFHLKGGNFKGASFPEVKGGKLAYKWYPKKERLEVWTISNEPMEFYNGEVKFFGKLIITPRGASAKGKMFIKEDVQVESSYMTLKENEFDATLGTFTITDTADTSQKLLVAKKMNINYKIDKHSATFQTSAPGKPNVYFPQQKFRTTLGMGIYSREEQNVKLTPHPVFPKDNFVESTDKEKHDLKFFTEELFFSLSDKNIGSEGSDSILVADAIVYPKDGKVLITSDGKIAPLADAIIKVNQQHPEWHKIINASVDIKSAIKYEAAGDYSYVLDQKIPFENITTTRDTVSYATAEIPKEAKFQVTERIEFNGNVEFRGDRKFLKFDGEVKIKSTNPFLQNTWFAFADVVNPDSIFIPVKNPKNRRGDKLTVGVHYIPTRRLFYTNFLQPPREPKKDLNILLAEGGLTYDRNEKVFKIGPREKLEKKEFTGNFVSYNDEERMIKAFGLFNFPYKFPAEIAEVKTAGMFSDDQDDYEQKTNWVFILNLKNGMPKGATDAFTKNFKRMVLAFDDINLSDRLLQESIAELLPGEKEEKEKKMKSLSAKMNKAVVASTIDLGKEVGEPTIALAKVRFKYDFDSKAFYTFDSVGLISMENVSINKMVPAKILYSLGYVLPNGQATSDTVRIYLEYDENNWLYFEYYDTEVKTISSYFKYNQVIAEAVKKDAGKVAEKDKPQLFFRECKEEDKDAFLSRFSGYILNK